MKKQTVHKIQADRVEIESHYIIYTRPLLDKVTKEGWKPECKQDIVDLLIDVQLGYISCRRAADILFPQFAPVAQR